MLMSREEVLSHFFQKWNSYGKTEYIPLELSYGRILAMDVRSAVTLPVERVSAFDGIAVRSEDFRQGNPETEKWCEGKEYVRADTGDDFPDAYDAVLMIERVELREDGGIRLKKEDGKPWKINPGDGVRKAGSMIHKDDIIARDGEKITATVMAALAMGNIAVVPVYRKPEIVFIPTGSELIPVGVTPDRGENIDTNSLLAAQMGREMGAEIICYPIVKDQKQELENALKKAVKTADIVIINGGSSKGGEDFNTQLLKEMGELIQHGVSAVPGRPMAFAVIDGKAVINLPGPNLAAYFGMDWCIRGLVEHWYHQTSQEKILIDGILMEEMPAGGPVEILHKLKVVLSDTGEYLLYPLDFRKGNTIECLKAKAQYVTRIFEECHPAGSVLRVEIKNV